MNPEDVPDELIEPAAVAICSAQLHGLSWDEIGHIHADRVRRQGREALAAVLPAYERMVQRRADRITAPESTGDLRERLVSAIENVRGLDDASGALADAALHVVEHDILAVQVDATERADTLAARLQGAERQRDEAREALDAAAIVIVSLRDQRDEALAAVQRVREVADLAAASDSSNVALASVLAALEPPEGT